MERVDVIIPVYHEADTLPCLLGQLSRQRGVALHILVADGGSRDDTVAVATALGATVVASAPGRARQMNTAAAAGRGDYLLFLHADSRLDHPRHLADALDCYRDHTACHGLPLAGWFALKFQRTAPGPPFFYRYYEAKSRLARVECRNGDQGMLIRRHFFQSLGGFDESWPFLEDRTMAARLAQQGQWLLLPGLLTTSARRFEVEGPLRRQVVNGLLLAMRQAGVDTFLTAAPGLYRAPGTGQRLRPAPFFALARRLLRQHDAPWLAMGQFLAGTGWQVFFLLDVLGPAHWGWGTPCLSFYDRWPGPLLRWRGLAWPMALASWMIFHLLWLGYALRDAIRSPD